jgi:N-acetylglutamate synthase-like GNAT family acetyltransferase
VRHATEADLDRIEALLGRIRRIDGLIERKRGNFQRRSKAFLHFHEDAGDVYADVRLADDFVRRRVSTPAEQTALVGEIEALLSRRP